METREDVLVKALSAWDRPNSFPTEYIRKAFIVGTGIGKTKLAITIAARDKYKKVLWLTNSTKLRDVDSPDEFDKWGYSRSHVTFECYQSAYKWVDTEWDLVVADEGDFALTPEYIKFFYNNSYKDLLFLTATVTDDKSLLLENLANIVFEFSTQDAQSSGILNKSKFSVVFFPLSSNNDIKVSYKKGKKEIIFYTSEEEQYTYYQDKYDTLIAELEILKDQYNTLLSAKIATENLDNIISKIEKTEKKLRYVINKRRDLLYNLKSSVVVARRLAMQIITKYTKSKVIVFSKRTEQANAISRYSYHSKNSSDVNLNNISKLNSGEVRVLSVVDSLNRGANLVGVSHAIKESYHGSDTDFQQQHGRLMRLDVGDIASLTVLIPYYYAENTKGEKEVRLTRTYKWFSNMTSKFNLGDINYFKYDKSKGYTKLSSIEELFG